MISISRSAIAVSVCFLIVLLCGHAVAETLWVKPSSEITMRRGQGTDFKIVAVIRDGTPVELLETQDDWARIRMENGKDGWVLSRFLSDEPPLGEQVEILKSEKLELTRTAEEQQQQVAELTDQRSEIEEQFKACIADRDSINDQYSALQADTTDVVNTKKALAHAQAKVESLEKDLSRYREENGRLSKNETLKWFLAGGGVLFVGWLIGLISRRSKKKRPSLL